MLIKESGNISGIEVLTCTYHYKLKSKHKLMCDLPFGDHEFAFKKYKYLRIYYQTSVMGKTHAIISYTGVVIAKPREVW